MLPWKPEFQSNQPKYLMQSFPPPDDALYEIWSQLASWQRYKSLKKWTDDGGKLVY